MGGLHMGRHFFVHCMPASSHLSSISWSISNLDWPGFCRSDFVCRAQWSSVTSARYIIKYAKCRDRWTLTTGSLQEMKSANCKLVLHPHCVLLTMCVCVGGRSGWRPNVKEWAVWIAVSIRNQTLCNVVVLIAFTQTLQILESIRLILQSITHFSVRRAAENLNFS